MSGDIGKRGLCDVLWNFHGEELFLLAGLPALRAQSHFKAPGGCALRRSRSSDVCARVCLCVCLCVCTSEDSWKVYLLLATLPGTCTVCLEMHLYTHPGPASCFQIGNIYFLGMGGGVFV